MEHQIKILRSGNFYMRSAEAGLLASVAFALSAVELLVPLVGVLSAIALCLSLAVVCQTRLRDEYLDRLWAAGTVCAFATALAVTIGSYLFGGGLNLLADLAGVPHDDFTKMPGLSGLAVGSVVIFGFFLGFHLKRLTFPS